MKDFAIQESKWVTSEETRKILGIGRTKLFYLRKNNELKYAVHGRKVYILRQSINEYIERYSANFDFKN
ncbi:MAG: helix-turn-helix domain-containing protein [Saprospiraceae bacterium]|nr:helix-turn-helix domain-containing protein [Saprospiraceae bacterium]